MSNFSLSRTINKFPQGNLLYISVTKIYFSHFAQFVPETNLQVSIGDRASKKTNLNSCKYSRNKLLFRTMIRNYRYERKSVKDENFI